MAAYPPYQNYTTTSCKWFPEIPAHWSIDRAKWSVSACQNGIWGAEPNGDDDLACIRVADFDRQSLRVSTEKLTMRSIEAKERRNRLLETGDLLLEKSGGGEQQLVGAVVEFNQSFPAVSSNFIARMVACKEVSSRFLVYVHSHLYAGRVNYRSIKQTTGIQNLDSQAYLDELIAYPPHDEQQAIAHFLDFKTAQIDALIAKKQTLLDKLAEKRTALISHAVTKGLDPQVKMKDSGVAWLGEIPAHWKISALKRHWSVTDCKHVTAEFVEEGYPLASIREVQSRWVELEDAKRTTEYFYQLLIEGGRKPRLGDLIFSRNATVGEVAQVHADHPPFAMGQDVVLLRKFFPEFSSDFLQLVIRSVVVTDQLALSMIGSTFKRINVEEIRSLVVPFPPPCEQRKICQHLEAFLLKIDEQTAKVKAAVERLREYRSALITNAVTGKIDVRGFQISQETPPEASHD